MKVLWFVNLLLSPVARALGLSVSVYGGWLLSLLEALTEAFPSVEFCIVCQYSKVINIHIGNVHYLTLREKDTLEKKSEQIGEIVASFQPDVVHIHGTEHFYASLAAEVFCGRPVLVSLQGIINGCSPHFNGGLAPFELAPFYHYLRGLIRHDNVFQVQERWYKGRSVTEQSSICTQKYFAGRTEWDHAWVKAINPQGAYYHLDEVLRPEFYQAARAADQIRRHSVYCGGAATYPLKGLHCLLKAVKILQKKYPDVQVRVANALNSLTCSHTWNMSLKDNQYWRYLRHLVEKDNLSGNVVPLPPLSAAECVRELQHAHIFVLPSLCENSPNALCEAMLLGTPSIAMYAGGIPSILENGSEGFLCQPGDPAALADAIDRLFADDVLAQKFGASARVRAIKRHDPETIAKQAYNIYSQLAVMR